MESFMDKAYNQLAEKQVQDAKEKQEIKDKLTTEELISSLVEDGNLSEDDIKEIQERQVKELMSLKEENEVARQVKTIEVSNLITDSIFEGIVSKYDWKKWEFVFDQRSWSIQFEKGWFTIDDDVFGDWLSGDANKSLFDNLYTLTWMNIDEAIAKLNSKLSTKEEKESNDENELRESQNIKNQIENLKKSNESDIKYLEKELKSFDISITGVDSLLADYKTNFSNWVPKNWETELKQLNESLESMKKAKENITLISNLISEYKNNVNSWDDLPVFDKVNWKEVIKNPSSERVKSDANEFIDWLYDSALEDIDNTVAARNFTDLKYNSIIENIDNVVEEKNKADAEKLEVERKIEEKIKGWIEYNKKHYTEGSLKFLMNALWATNERELAIKAIELQASKLWENHKYVDWKIGRWTLTYLGFPREEYKNLSINDIVEDWIKKAERKEKTESKVLKNQKEEDLKSEMEKEFDRQDAEMFDQMEQFEEERRGYSEMKMNSEEIQEPKTEEKVEHKEEDEKHDDDHEKTQEEKMEFIRNFFNIDKKKDKNIDYSEYVDFENLKDWEVKEFKVEWDNENTYYASLSEWTWAFDLDTRVTMANIRTHILNSISKPTELPDGTVINSGSVNWVSMVYRIVEGDKVYVVAKKHNEEPKQEPKVKETESKKPETVAKNVFEGLNLKWFSDGEVKEIKLKDGNYYVTSVEASNYEWENIIPDSEMALINVQQYASEKWFGAVEPVSYLKNHNRLYVMAKVA